MEFLQAKWFRGGGNESVSRIVLHDMEFPEKPDAAEAVAEIFHRGRVDANGKPIKSSAHYCVDDNSIVQCVRDFDVAFHAPPNPGSIGVEHAGYARQTTGDWLDAYGTSMLRDVSAPLVRGLCDKHNLPKVWLSVADLKAGKRGVTSHNNVSLAFGQSTHTDPGPNFPVDQYMAWVAGATDPSPIPHEDFDMFIYSINNQTAYFVFNGKDVVGLDENSLNELKSSGVRYVGERNVAFHNRAVDSAGGANDAGKA